MKTTLRSINSTLSTVTENERNLAKGMEELEKYVNSQDGKIKDMFTTYSLLLTIDEHVIQLNKAIDECRREYEILLMLSLIHKQGLSSHSLSHLHRF